jgi:hypothetical protein
MRKHGILALLLASACYAPLDAHAATCTNASLSGGYVISVTGHSVTNPFSAVGQLTADGLGGLTGVMTMSSNGQVSRSVAVTGTYTTLATQSALCTGTATINYTGGGNLTFDIVLAGGGFSGVQNK